MWDTTGNLPRTTESRANPGASMNGNSLGPFALLSVSDKTGLVPLAQKLVASGLQLLSTGGTAQHLRDAGLVVHDVASITEFPEMMHGRVKTLHPRIHGGLLARRELPEHVEAMEEHGVADIQVLVVNLYPFVETVRGKSADEVVIENIDIGGPAMIRAAAKNHQHIVVLVDPHDYDLEFAAITPVKRRELAGKAYAHTAAYDAAIASYFAGEESASLNLTGLSLTQELRYGENPHQQASLYTASGAAPLGGLDQLQGKELSYNNIIDLEAALLLVHEFDAPAAAIIKHTNPCGCASASDIARAFDDALAGDPVSAFGGIVALNRAVDEGLATRLCNTFFEVIAAPGFSAKAREVLAAKKNARVLVIPDNFHPASHNIRLTSLGWLRQDADPRISWDPLDLQFPTKIRPNEAQLQGLEFLWRVCKHVKSNAIVVGTHTATLGVGAGQMSRVDSVKAATQHSGHREGLLLASDAFFPFRDGVDEAAKAGVVGIVQPGGSKRDDEVIAACDELGIAMIYTGMRHFRH